MKSISNDSLLQSENNDLRAQVADLEGKLTKIMTEKNLSSTEISSIFRDQHNITELKAKLRESQLESSKYRAILDAQESSILNSISVDDSLKSQILDTKNQLSLEYMQKEKEQLQEISMAQLENSKLRNQLCTSEAKNAEQLLRIKELESKLGEIDGNDQFNGAVNKRLQGSIGDLQARYEQLQAKYQDSLKTIEKIKDQNNKEQESLKKQIQQLTEQVNTYKQKIAADSVQITKLDTQLTTAKSQIARCEQLISQFETNKQSEQQEHQQQIVRLKNEINDLKNVNNQLSFEKQTMTQKSDSIKTNLMSLQQENQILTKKNQDLTDLVNKNKIDLQNSLQKNKELQSSIFNCQQENDSLKNHNSDLQNIINQSKNDNQQLLQKYKEIQSKYQTLQINFEEHQKDKIKIQSKLDEMVMENENQIRKSAMQSNAMEQSLTSVKNENQKLIQQNQMKDEQIKDLENNLDLEIKEKQNLTNDISNIQGKFNKLLQLLNDEKAKVVKLESQNSSLKSQLNSKNFDPEKDQIQKELESARKENIKLQSDIGVIQQRIEQEKLMTLQLSKHLQNSQQNVLNLTKQKYKHNKFDPEAAKYISNKIAIKFKHFCKMFIVRIALLETHIQVLSNSITKLQVLSQTVPMSQKDKINLAIHQEIIDILSKKAARAYRIHKNEVPSAALLVNNEEIRNEFFSKLVKQHHYCNHTDEDVQRVLNSVSLYKF